MTAKRHRKRRHASQAIFAKRAMIANQERCDLFTRLCGLRHGLNEVMVGIAFIGKARALARHRNDAGLGAVDEVRHHALARVFAHRDRDRHPGRGIRQGILDAAAGCLRQPQSIAGVAGRSRRPMFIARRRMREHRLAPLDVVRKAAAGEDDAAFGVDANEASVFFHHRTAHRAILDDQLAHRRR